MLTPIAGSILSVHAHAIGASHGSLVELDISDRVWFAGGIGKQMEKEKWTRGWEKWIGWEAKKQSAVSF
jgi:hypothetical protein